MGLSARRSWISAGLAFALAGCAGHGVAVAPPVAPAPARALPHGASAPAAPARAADVAPDLALPAVARRFVESTGKGALGGTVSLQLVTSPFFGDSAASFHLLSAMSAGHALVTLTTLDEAVYTHGGVPIATTADLGGSFKLAGVPSDTPFVVCAQLAGDHRLAALVPAGAPTVAVDERTTAVVEEARWQLAAAPVMGRQTLAGLAADTLASLVAATADVLDPADFVAHGAVPAISVLKSGNGLALRNAYVRAFGQATSAGGKTSADTLSDLWRTVLGYRPLALTRVPGVDPATLQADDAVMDADGNLFIAPHNNFLIYRPAHDRGPLPGSSTPLQGGHLYSLAGQVNGGSGPGTLAAYNAQYGPIETASAADPAKAPLATDGAPVWMPYRLMIEPVAASATPHLFFTSRQGHRLYLIPGADLARYGRTFLAGHLYTIAGNGAIEAPGPVIEPDDPATPNVDETVHAYLLGDGGPAYQAPLAYPLGVAEDSRHNLYICDAGTYAQAAKNADPAATLAGASTDPALAGRLLNVYHQAIRLVRASDGQIFTFHLTKDGAPYALSGAADVRVAETPAGNFVYVTDSLRHAVVRFPLPADLAALDAAPPAPQAVEVVLGALDAAGSLAPGVPTPTLDTLADGLASAQVRLDTPTAIELDPAGNLLVADAGHVRLLEAPGAAGRVYMLAGAVAGGFAEGDSRLASVHPRSLTRQPGTGDMVLVDDLTGAVLRLGTGRGVR